LFARVNVDENVVFAASVSVISAKHSLAADVIQ